MKPERTSPGPGTSSGPATVDADVIVVGGGGSGLAAAIEAASFQRKVILVEKDDRCGGTTGRSVGSITASNTPHQLRKGILDSPDDHYEDLRTLNAHLGLPDNEGLSRLLVDNVTDTLRWLMAMGLEFHGPIKELPHRKPRMHNILPNSRAYIFHLEREARRRGVDIRTGTAARSLVMERGRVVGLECEKAGERITLRARGGVVLCSGDYSGSADKRARYLAPHMASVPPVNPSNTGDGHDMVLEIGGRIINAHLNLAGIRLQAPRPSWIMSLPPWRPLTKLMNFALTHFGGNVLRPLVMSFLTTVVPPSPRLFQSGAILINKAGERFCDELHGPGPHVAAQPEQLAYILLDGKLVERFTGWPDYVSTAPGFAYASIADYRRTRKDIFKEASTLGELAAKIGVPAGALEQTLHAYNASLAGKGAGVPLDRGPYVALGPVRYFINFTDGGLAVNEHLQVLGPGDAPVPGLYAAGFTGMGGVLLEGHGHHLGWAFTSGRLAGRRAAFEARGDDIPEAAGYVHSGH